MIILTIRRIDPYKCMGTMLNFLGQFVNTSSVFLSFLCVSQKEGLGNIKATDATC